MKLKQDSSEQKLRGAYYTPKALAQKMLQLSPIEPGLDVLEPSCGDGVFLESLDELDMMDNCKSITAIEIENDEAQKVKDRFKQRKNISVTVSDFFDFYKEALPNQKYDVILGNPPYIRYQYLKESQREILSEILTSHGMKANKLINAWVAFVVACVQLLTDNGKIAFVIPAEILQVAYAEDLRLYLSEHLQRITLLTFRQLIFPEIEQEVLVFIGEKGGDESGIRILEFDDLDDLESCQSIADEFQPLMHVKEKWTKYFVNAAEMKTIDAIKKDKRFCQFSSFGIINVGITTGNNKYFSVTEDVVDEYDLSRISLPLIGRSSHAHGVYFTYEDWQKNVKDGKRAMLVNFPETPYEDYPEKHREYIKLGEDKEENVGYKCSIRDRWYIIPSVWVPDAFFLRRNNLYPKFVINKCNAVSTDTMHRMKFNEDVIADDVLLSYYNSISFAFTEICGRSYGGGVLEILPGEMGRIMLPKVESANEQLKKELIAFVDKVIREESDIEEALDLVDKRLLVDSLGIPSKWCAQCRTIWKKLQKRRLDRGE